MKCFGSTISWSSKKQTTVSLSSAEALVTGLSATMGIVNLMKEMGLNPKLSFTVFEDNRPCIGMVKNGIRIKHIDIRLHFIQDLVKKNIYTINYIPSQEQVADVLTKTNPKLSFETFRNMLGMTNQHRTRGSVEECPMVYEQPRKNRWEKS